MRAIFLSSKSSKTLDPHSLVLDFSDKISLKKSEKYVISPNLTIYYKGKMLQSHIKKIKLICNPQYGMINLNYLMHYIFVANIQDYSPNIVKENKSQEFELGNIVESRNYLLKQNNSMIKKHKKLYFNKILNYIEQPLILVNAISGCISISSFATLIDILIGTASSAVALKIYVITMELKNQSRFFKNRKRVDY